MIEVTQLSRCFSVHQKEPGLKGTLKALFKRDAIEKWAVRDVSFSVGAGEIVGLVGANGAGKTTLVKMLSGIVYPTSGTAKVLGHTPWERAVEFRKKIALIMGQKAQLWWDLPAADCFLLLREIYQIPKDSFASTLAYLVEMLEVQQQLKTQIRRLSLGERMKMELIAALLHNPQVVYLDEPTIGLDITSQRAMRKFILHYKKERNPAMILTSHYMEDIEELCERIIIIREGSIVYDGPTTKISENFATSRVLRIELASGSSAHAPLRLSHGQLLSREGEVLTIRTARASVPSCIGEILSQCAVVDIAVEEEDIGTIIEAIMRTGTLQRGTV